MSTSVLHRSAKVPRRRVHPCCAVFVCIGLVCAAGCEAATVRGSYGDPPPPRADAGATAPLDAGDSPTDPGPTGGSLVVMGPGAPSDAADRFDAPPITDAARALDIVYPLDGVLLPSNVFAPDVQWNPRGAEGDLYRVRFDGCATTLTAYLGHTGAGFRHDYAIEPGAWRSLADRCQGSRLTLSVDRWDSAADEVISSPPIEVRVARGGIAGAVYYWALGEFGGTEGRILRVRQGTATPPTVENFLPQPPPGGDGERCAACHGLARDGNRMAISFDDGTFGGVVDLTEDLTGPTPPLVFRFERSWFYAAFSPDGSRIFMTDAAQGSFLLDGETGSTITPSSGALPSATHPAWSPDGTQIAMIRGGNDAWNPSAGNLVVMPVTGSDAFGPAERLHAGSDLASASEGGGLDAYPSYSPDSRFIAFQHGTRTVASAGAARGALYLVSRDGGAPIRLGRASAGDNAYYPNFTPFETPSDTVGSVYWLLFYSTRDYGNELAGTRGTRRRQIWVTAVSTDVSSGDPSNVPYWLPGQETEQQNASAYWAPVPCRTDGQSCANGAQCCSALCDDGMCAPPASCREEGETCTVSADCCDATLACAAGVCVDAPI